MAISWRLGIGNRAEIGGVESATGENGASNKCIAALMKDGGRYRRSDGGQKQKRKRKECPERERNPGEKREKERLGGGSRGRNWKGGLGDGPW